MCNTSSDGGRGGRGGGSSLDSVGLKKRGVVKLIWRLEPVRPKARGLAQHGGPPGWLEESEPAGVIFYVMDGPYRLPFPYCTGCPQTGAAQLRADGISSCCYIVNVHNHPS
jgi:hypothetical protein